MNMHISYEAEAQSRPDLNLIVAQRARAIIDVAIPGASGHFQSAILAVDATAKTITIDELFPHGFTGLPGQPITVTLRLDGHRRESFRTEIIERRVQNDSERYLLKLPNTVRYQQRRAAYRVSVAQSRGCDSEFFSPGYARCAASVRDISPSGIRLELQDWTPVQQGDLLEELHFELLGNRYQCRANVRNVRVKNETCVEIGAAFVDLPRPQQRVLERSIMQLQRQQLAQTAGSRTASN